MPVLLPYFCVEMKLEELAKEGRYAWEAMMFYLNCNLPNPEYVRCRIHTWNKRWFDINDHIRRGEYDG